MSIVEVPVTPVPNADRKTALEWILAAHAAERAGEFKNAFNLHTKAGNLLTTIIAQGQRGSETRRKDKLWLRASVERRKVLQPAAEGSGQPLAGPLPSVFTRLHETQNPDGKVLLSQVHLGLWPSLAGPVTDFGGILADTTTLSSFTGLLPPSSTHPPVAYDLHLDMSTTRGRCYIHVTDTNATQTLYTLATIKQARYQIPGTYMYWATDYNMPCATVKNDIVQVGKRVSDAFYGRTQRVAVRPHPGFGVMDVDMVPDKSVRNYEKTHYCPWAPRRFEYGGRKFEWRVDKGDRDGVATSGEAPQEQPPTTVDANAPDTAPLPPSPSFSAKTKTLASKSMRAVTFSDEFEALYEINPTDAPSEAEQFTIPWPVSGDSIGQTYTRSYEALPRKLVWSQRYISMFRRTTSPGLMRIATVWMVGGLDQTFREFVLAGIGAKMMVMYYGNA